MLILLHIIGSAIFDRRNNILHNILHFIYTMNGMQVCERVRVRALISIFQAKCMVITNFNNKFFNMNHPELSCELVILDE